MKAILANLNLLDNIGNNTKYNTRIPKSKGSLNGDPFWLTMFGNEIDMVICNDHSHEY